MERLELGQIAISELGDALVETNRIGFEGSSITLGPQSTEAPSDAIFTINHDRRIESEDVISELFLTSSGGQQINLDSVKDFDNIYEDELQSFRKNTLNHGVAIRSLDADVYLVQAILEENNHKRRK